MTLVCDTGVLYAALDRRDRDHDACSRLLAEPLTAVAPIGTLVEVEQLGHRRGAPSAVEALLDSVLDGSLLLASPDLDELVRIRHLVEQYRDLPLGFVDASVIATAERLEQDTIATLDHRHFSVVRPRHVAAFTLVP
jgi:predicted nucleic acid-binding protein